MNQIIRFVFFIATVAINPLYAAKTSAQSGNWNLGTTWVGGVIPAVNDDVTIAAGHTVTLVANVTLHYLTIEVTAVLEAGTYDYVNNYNGDVNYIYYTNNGTHNATTGVIYIDGGMGINGSGTTNCDIEIRSDGAYFVSTCNLTINGNILLVGPALGGIIYNDGGTLTINGDITLQNYGLNMNYNSGTINQTGNVLFDDTMIDNYGTWNISGIASMGNLQTVYFVNYGTITIGGNYLGSVANGGYFLQEANAIARFGGSLFPPGNEGELIAAGTSDVTSLSVEPNTIEYNGAGNQDIKSPTIGFGSSTADTYSNLIISNSGIKTMKGSLIINGDLTIQNAATMDVTATPYNIDLKGNWVNTSSVALTEQSGTVTLSSSSAQSITASAVTETFYNLTLSSSSTKTLAGNIAVNGNLNIQNTAQLDVSATPYNIDLKGNWVNTTTTSLTERTGTVTLSGTSAQSITANSVAGGETFCNLTCSNTSGNVSLNNDVTLGGALSFTNGKIILGTYDLTLSTPTAITGCSSSSYVVTDNTGYLQINDITTPAMDFPVGISTSSYTPANIHNNGVGATATDFSVRVADKVYSYQGNVQINDMVDRTWYITETGGIANATLTLLWNAAEELGTFDRSNSGISRYNAPAWDVPPVFSPAGGGTLYSQTRTGISSFSSFAVEGLSHPLPIELLSFTGEQNAEGQIVLNWETATETNNDYFTVERGTPSAPSSVLRTSTPKEIETLGINFTPIGIVKGAGNSTVSIDYNFVDNPAPSGAINPPLSFGEGQGERYYRLKQTDYDGKYSYSPIISIRLENAGTLLVYPNPAANIIHLNMQSKNEELLFIKVIDKLGRTIISKEENMGQGVNDIHLDVSDLSSGIYLLQITAKSGIAEQKPLMIY